CIPGRSRQERKTCASCQTNSAKTVRAQPVPSTEVLVNERTVAGFPAKRLSNPRRQTLLSRAYWSGVRRKWELSGGDSMSSSAKAMLLAAIIGIGAYLSFAAEKATWNSPSGQDFPTVGGNLPNQR